MKKLFLLLAAGMLLTGCGNTETVRPTFYVNEDGHLIEVYNGNETDLGLVKGQDGKDGTNGQNGKDGKDGLDGKDGVNGQDGKDGRDGVDGKDGLNGKDGKDGLDGKDGADGKDGQDGRDGTDGKDGRDGVDGKDGQDGKDGEVVVIERYNEYWEQLCKALSNASYVDDSNYSLEDGHTFEYLAVYVNGKSGTKNCVVGYHSLGATESFMHSWGLEYSDAHWVDTHTQYCCIKRNDTVDYTDYLPKPISEFDSYYHGEVHHEKVFGPSENYEHTLNGMGLHILVNAKVECTSSDTAISYNGCPAWRVVISYEDDYHIGTPDGVLEEVRVSNRLIKPEEHKWPWQYTEQTLTTYSVMFDGTATAGSWSNDGLTFSFYGGELYQDRIRFSTTDGYYKCANNHTIMNFKLNNIITEYKPASSGAQKVITIYEVELISAQQYYTVYNTNSNLPFAYVAGEYYIKK